MTFFSRNTETNIRVALGKQNLKMKENHEQIFDAAQIILHDKYREKDGVLYNDIGKSFILYSRGSPPTCVVWCASLPLKSM